MSNEDEQVPVVTHSTMLQLTLRTGGKKVYIREGAIEVLQENQNSTTVVSSSGHRFEVMEPVEPILDFIANVVDPMEQTLFQLLEQKVPDDGPGE